MAGIDGGSIASGRSTVVVGWSVMALVVTAGVLASPLVAGSAGPEASTLIDDVAGLIFLLIGVMLAVRRRR